jgi:hypothetical protein
MAARPIPLFLPVGQVQGQVMPHYQSDAPAPWYAIQKLFNLQIWGDRPTEAVAKSVVPVRQWFVTISYNILIYRDIMGNLRGLLFGNNVVRAASRG